MKEIMKRTLKIVGAGLCFAGLLAASSAQATTQLTFDENGHATNGLAGIPSQQAADSHVSASGNPSGNGAITLDYLYAPPAGTFLSMGWVAIYDDTAHTQLSDLIHFDSSTQIVSGGITNTYEQIFFYSSDTNGGGLADHWVGSNTLSGIFAASTTVKITEGANGIPLYAPTSGQPGFDNGSGATPFTYAFISTVPEPTTAACFLLGLGALACCRRFNRNRRS